jgi:hypothetical protein
LEQKIEVGFQVFASDGGEEFGAVREVAPGGRPEMVIYVENSGDFAVPVILNCKHLEPRLRAAIGHAHDSEEPGA